MKDSYNFDCGCEGCDITQEEEEKESSNCKLFRTFNEKRPALKQSSSWNLDLDLNLDLEKEVFCLKNMYSLSKEIKTINLKNVLSIILEDGFDAACELCFNGNLCKTNDYPAEMLDVQFFSSHGLELSILLHGENHSTTREWVERREDPAKYYNKD